MRSPPPQATHLPFAKLVMQTPCLARLSRRRHRLQGLRRQQQMAPRPTLLYYIIK